MAKLIFQLQSNANTLWVRILRGKYSTEESPKFPNNSSALWKGIGKLLQEVNLHIHKMEPSNTWTKLWQLPMAKGVKTFSWLLLFKKWLLTNS